MNKHPSHKWNLNNHKCDVCQSHVLSMDSKYPCKPIVDEVQTLAVDWAEITAGLSRE